MSWNTICSVEDVVLNTGVAALVDGEQVAIFRVKAAEGEAFYAVSNYDPFSNANVVSRGIVGSIDDQVVVSSPLYKQHFRLDNGQCLQDQQVSLKTWAVNVQDGRVLVASKAEQVAA